MNTKRIHSKRIHSKRIHLKWIHSKRIHSKWIHSKWIHSSSFKSRVCNESRVSYWKLILGIPRMRERVTLANSGNFYSTWINSSISFVFPVESVKLVRNINEGFFRRVRCVFQTLEQQKFCSNVWNTHLTLLTCQHTVAVCCSVLPCVAACCSVLHSNVWNTLLTLLACLKHDAEMSQTLRENVWNTRLTLLTCLKHSAQMSETHNQLCSLSETPCWNVWNTLEKCLKHPTSRQLSRVSRGFQRLLSFEGCPQKIWKDTESAKEGCFCLNVIHRKVFCFQVTHRKP